MDATAAPRPAPAAERAARMMRGLEWLMAPVVVALGFLLASFAVRNSDFWMHLATGRLIAEGKYQFGVDPFSFATEGRTWVNHSWLFDLLLWKTYNLNADHSAVVYAKAGLVALLALVLLLACRPDPRDAIIPGTKANPTGWLAAVAASLALLAAGPRLLLQPTVVSILFAAITFYVLHHSARWPAKALPITLGVLFALWVNLDQWFFIGPLMVALYLAGEALQRLHPIHAPGRVRLLAITLAVGLAACLLNPHHVRAFTTLPPELYPTVVRDMRTEPGHRLQFLSLVRLRDVELYFSRPELGNNVPGFSFVTLIVAGVASFALNFWRLRLAHLLIWLGLLALSLYNWRLIPFFAVVAAPIAVLNFHAFFAARPLRRNVIAAPAAPAVPEDGGGAAPAAQEGWWPGATEPAGAPAATAAAAEPESVRRRPEGLTVTPETMLDFAGIMGRLLTVVAGAAALVLTYPGWLHATGSLTANQRRLSWDVAPDRAHVQAAAFLQKAHEKGALPAAARGMALSLDVSNYMTFFAPDVRTFMDHRFPLLGHLSADFMRVKRGLAEHVNQIEGPQDYAQTLRDLGVSYLVAGTDPEAGGELLVRMMIVAEDEWALWFQNGRDAVFGWHDPKGPPSPDPLRQDLVSMAFGRDVVPLRPGEEYGVTREPPPETPAERGTLERFLGPPPPEPPTETLAASLYWALRDNAYERAREAARPVFGKAISAAWVGRFAAPNYFTPLSISSPPEVAEMLVQRMAREQPLPTAVELLAVREARRGALAHPNQGYPYLMLGLAYSTLPPVGGELRPLQQLATLHQALDRLTPEQIRGPVGRTVSTALLTLWDLHRHRNELDLTAEVLARAVAAFERYPPFHVAVGGRQMPVNDSNVEQIHQGLQRLLDGLQNDLLSARNKYSLERDQLKRRNASLAEQVSLALRYGLVREALRVVEDSPPEKLELPVLRQAAQMYVWLGRVEDAQRVMSLAPEQARPQFAVLQMYLWVAAGEYARAGKALEGIMAAAEQSDDPRRQFVEAALMLQQWHFACVEPAAQSVLLGMIPWALDETPGAGNMPRNPVGFTLFNYRLVGLRSQKAELKAMRAMLALEEGDIPTARKFFKEAVELRAPFAGDANAALYHRVLERVHGR